MSREQLIEELMEQSYEAMKKFLAEHALHSWVNQLGELVFEWEPLLTEGHPNVEDLL